MTISEFRAAMRNGPFAWPGCYPLYFAFRGAPLSFEGARQERRAILDAIRDNPACLRLCVNWEDGGLFCDATDTYIPSAYGED